MIPTGVASREKISFNKRNEKCLIYYKNRDEKDLKVVEFLNNINYDLFEYGKYSNKRLMNAAKKINFVFYLILRVSRNCVREILSMNLPMYVWDLPTNKSIILVLIHTLMKDVE